VIPGKRVETSVAILIVNWNSKDLLRQCLLSIRDTCADLRPQIIVVDSGSFDGCGEMLAGEFPEVEFVQSSENIGFGRSNNLGFARVTADAVLLLNPDTEVQAGAVQTLLRELEGHKDAGIVSPRLLNPDRTLQSSVHALPKPLRQALDSEILRRLLSPYSLWAPPTDFSPKETVAVEAVAGTCMLLWTKTFRGVGGFSPEYFMYAEDMDLCFKVLRAGFGIYHVPAAEVVHHGGASSSSQGSTFSAVMMREALHSYMLLNHGRGHARSYRFATGGWALLRMLILVPSLVLGSTRWRAVRRAAFERWWSVLSWSCGQQKWTKRFPTARVQSGDT
jgi:GT2 family glycosyltransferase